MIPTAQGLPSFLSCAAVCFAMSSIADASLYWKFAAIPGTPGDQIARIGIPAAFAFAKEGWMPFGSSGQMRIMLTFFWIAAFIATIWAWGLYWPPIVSKFMPSAFAFSAIPSLSALIAGFAITGGMNPIVTVALGFAETDPASSALATIAASATSPVAPFFICVPS